MAECKKRVSLLDLKFQIDNLQNFQQQWEDLFSECFSIQAQLGFKYLEMCKLYMNWSSQVQI